MTLAERVTTYKRETATRANRAKVTRVNRRADEIAVVAEIETDYQRVDRAGDLRMESWFVRAYQSAATATPEEMRTILVEGFREWTGTEQSEEGVVVESVGDATDVLKGNNPYWLSDGCGPDGRAA